MDNGHPSSRTHPHLSNIRPNHMWPEHTAHSTSQGAPIALGAPPLIYRMPNENDFYRKPFPEIINNYLVKQVQCTSLHVLPQTCDTHESRLYPFNGLLLDEGIMVKVIDVDHRGDENARPTEGRRRCAHGGTHKILTRGRDPWLGRFLDLRNVLNIRLLPFCTCYGIETNVRLLITGKQPKRNPLAMCIFKACENASVLHWTFVMCCLHTFNIVVL